MKYYKEIDEHLLGHLYEHIVGERLSRKTAGQVPLADFKRIEAYTWDKVIFFDTDLPIKEADAQNFLPEEIERARQEISLEYGKEVEIIDALEILRRMEKMRRAPWFAWNDFAMSRPFSKEDKVFNKPYIRRTRKQVRGKTIHIILEYKKLQPLLRPLAAYLLVILALFFSRERNRQFANYTINNEFAELSKQTGLAETMRIYDDISIEDILVQTQSDFRRFVDDKTISRKLVTRFQSMNMAEEELTDLDAYKESGYFIGHKGWQEISTVDNIKTILNTLTIRVEEAD